MTVETPCGRCGATGIYQAPCGGCTAGIHAGKPCEICEGSGREPVVCWHCEGAGTVSGARPRACEAHFEPLPSPRPVCATPLTRPAHACPAIDATVNLEDRRSRARSAAF